MLAKKIPQSPITVPIINQLIRAATSIGANYCEADDAHSKKDFLHKISICRKESRETKHWLKMILVAVPALKTEAELYLQEAQELNLIFSAIINRSRANQ
jgi:four helix bundle protein